MPKQPPPKFASPTKAAAPGTSSSATGPQIPTINTRELTRRVWIKRQDATPTSLYVKESHLIDDLKTLIVEKFPMTLAKMCDPSELIIKLEPNMASSTSPNYYNSPSTPGQRKFLIPPINTAVANASYNSPLSPIPVSVNKSSLVPRAPSAELHNLSLRSVSPASLPLDADRSVWGILDQYYPNGMSIDNAFIVEVPHQVYHNPGPPSSQRKSVSQETITEDKEQDFHSNPRRISLPGQNTSRSSTPGAHRRSQSNPSEQSSAVLLLPSSDQKQQHTDTPDRVVSPRAPLDRTNTASPSSRLGNGKSTMDKVLPSVSVLIVEDNLINLRILSAHLRRHRIHYDVAKNGQEAIDKWRKGGFHLVLMDIQLPVMSGLEASKMIRRLEKLNHIGVFSNSDLQNLPPRKREEELDLNIFRSPVIIVALTASNLKQDKQQALAAGCNDYLTKPVNLDWLLNKITEWGCMQALIDFDGWKSGERMTNISAALPSLTRKSSSRRVLSGERREAQTGPQSYA